jgi:hypothetical protein
MIWQVVFKPARASDSDKENGAKHRVDCSPEALQHGIMRCVQNRQMERLVRSDGTCLIVRRFHRHESSVDPRTILLCAAHRRHCRGSRLNDHANFLDSEKKVAVRLICSDQPTEDVPIEETPIPARQNMRAVSGAHTHESLACQYLDSFAYNTAPDAKSTFQTGLWRQGRPHRNNFLRYLAAERRQHRLNATGLRSFLRRLFAIRGHGVRLA